uniref:ATP synthase CF0 B subunit n=1 Tax=Phacellanthus tubiflorus TaxID=2028290 RepID=UPI0022389F2F|nr:ATP synthase CF0 B subunit [Phacellanthus tubiflorus]UYR95046.1 ATP synthase CF0 B subunit [Phacellanthus tubiflorus]
MKNITYSFIFLGYRSSAESLGFNTDILATNPINLSVVIGVLIFFGKGVLIDFLDNRKKRILKTIRHSEELCREAVDQLEKTKVRLRKMEIEADFFLLNGYFEIERENLHFVYSTHKTLEQLENYKNEMIKFEQQGAINQVKQRILQQALQGALVILNSCLTTELHLCTISVNIGILGAMKEITN